jgi:hypothetical protein
MVALIGQCRGDMQLFRRQLAAVQVTVSQKGLTRARNAPAFVVLGDVIGPLNAWCAYQARVASDDVDILQLVIRLSEELGVGVVPGVYELMLLEGDTRQCGNGQNHRKLLGLVADPDFIRSWKVACSQAPPSVKRAARHIKGILHDNDTRPPPVGLGPYWPLLSTFDRGTRFVVGGRDVPSIGLASTTFQPTPFALASHFQLEYHRARGCDLSKWREIVSGVSIGYHEFDAVRRRAIVVAESGVLVRDSVSGVLDPAGMREFETLLASLLEPLVGRFGKSTSTGTAALTRVAAAALGA